MKKKKKNDASIPEEIMRLIDSADAYGAGVMFFDTNNDAIYSNALVRDIYPVFRSNPGLNYEDLFWDCFKRKLLDDPEVYVDPRFWLDRALDYRRRTQFAQYIIRHNTGKIFLARHQVFPGVGTFSGRLDVTSEFSRQFPGYSSEGAFLDPVTGGTITITGKNESSLATAILSPSATVISANSRMMDFLERQDGLSLCDGRLTLALGEEHSSFARLVGQYSSSVWRDGEFPRNRCAMMRVTRRHKSGYYLVNIGLVPSGTWMSIAQMYGVCLVSIIDPSEEVVVPTETLQKVFDLTPAESKISVALASGSSPQEIAEKNQVSIGTVRNQIKAIYSKVGVKKQSELVRIVLNLSRISTY